MKSFHVIVFVLRYSLIFQDINLIPPSPNSKKLSVVLMPFLPLPIRLKQKFQWQGKRLEKLRQSILAKAFSGELVETEAEIARREGRDYETAEVLLERIKAERGMGGKKR